MLTITSAHTGTCLWCASVKEGVDVEFQDGSLKGFLCKTDFWKLVKARAYQGSVEVEKKARQPRGVASSSTGQSE